MIKDRLKDILTIQKCSIAEYEKLKHYVYVNRPVPPPIHVFKVTPKNVNNSQLPDPIAVIVYSAPLSCIAARNAATDNFFINGKTRSEQMTLINDRIIYLSRLVVDPYFWRLGIGSWLQEETVKMQTKPIIEVLTQYDFTANTLQKIGFKLHLNPAPIKYHRIKDTFAKYGISGTILNHPKQAFMRICKLPDRKQKRLFMQIKQFLHGFYPTEKSQQSLEAIVFLLDQLQYPHAYLIKEAENHRKNRRHPQYRKTYIVRNTTHNQKQQPTQNSNMQIKIKNPTFDAHPRAIS